MERITIDPKICHGKPVVKGTRVLVSNILSALASGDSIKKILEDYSNLEEQDIYAALDFGSQLSDFETKSYDLMVS